MLQGKKEKTLDFKVKPYFFFKDISNSYPKGDFNCFVISQKSYGHSWKLKSWLGKKTIFCI